MSKKGNKAKANTDSGETFKIGDLVLGRIKGYPPWPAKVVDPEKEYLTKEVLKTKPAKKQVHLVKYYTDGNYSWSADKELNSLTPKAIETFIGNKKGAGALLKAYKTAQDPESWEAEKEAEAEKAKDAGDDDELDSEDEVESKPTDGKRKRKADKPAKEAGDKKKAKVEKKETKPKGKADKKKPAAGGEDMSEGAVKCREWRHKLQKAFLTKSLPDEKEAPTYDKIFKEMEEFEHQANWLVPSKLPKVVKRIATIKEDIPRDSEFNFKSRASALVEKWKDSLMPDGEMDVDDKKAEETPVPATNGDAPAEEEKVENGDAEKKVEETPVPQDADAPADAPAEVDAKADEDMAAAPATSETAA